MEKFIQRLKMIGAGAATSGLIGAGAGIGIIFGSLVSSVIIKLYNIIKLNLSKLLLLLILLITIFFFIWNEHNLLCWFFEKAKMISDEKKESIIKNIITFLKTFFSSSSLREEYSLKLNVIISYQSSKDFCGSEGRLIIDVFDFKDLLAHLGYFDSKSQPGVLVNMTDSEWDTVLREVANYLFERYSPNMESEIKYLTSRLKDGESVKVGVTVFFDRQTFNIHIRLRSYVNKE